MKACCAAAVVVERTRRLATHCGFHLIQSCLSFDILSLIL